MVLSGLGRWVFVLEADCLAAVVCLLCPAQEMMMRVMRLAWSPIVTDCDGGGQMPPSLELDFLVS